jgi:hypothetical protein
MAMAITPNNAGAKNVGAGNGAQFITGGCVNDADCQSGCCADASGVGVCSAEAAQFQKYELPYTFAIKARNTTIGPDILTLPFYSGKNGCNFVDPNATATIAAAKAQVAKQGF